MIRVIPASKAAEITSSRSALKREVSMWAWLSTSKQKVLSDPGFCRGECDWVDVGWAFMVARGWACRLFIDESMFLSEPRRATIKAHPSRLRFPLPYVC